MKTESSLSIKKPPRRHSHFRKCWILAKTKFHWMEHTRLNSVIEREYLQLLTLVKQLYGNEPECLCYEKDSKRDSSENCCTMHTFTTSSIYLELECNFEFYYRIRYAFDHCPYERQIRQWLEGKAISHAVAPASLSKGVAAHFQAIPAFQDSRHFYKLNTAP